MSATTSARPDETLRPGRIDAKPVRHPWRWVAVAVIAVVVAMMVSSFLTNPRWDFSYAFQIMQQTPVIRGLWIGTIGGTIGSMILGVVLGVVLAVMRLSDNPVLRFVAFVYTWFFRAIPRYVLLGLIGVGIGFLYSRLTIGVPFGEQIATAVGIDRDTFTFFGLDWNAFSSTIWAGILGLGLSEAAYMAEIARAGIQSVDRGQTEAAQALGMPPGKTMRRIVLPQAMRVIVPPTGNETIAMVKDTSLLIAIPITNELFFQAYGFGQRSFKIMPGFVAATLWYLIVCSILMVGQHYLERYFGRGFGAPSKKAQQQLSKIEADH
ncbi:Putative ABC-type amino acid transport system,permease component [Nostocoides japonicum T1-X7]|uniref:Putative ABC-type amino acid transport system,permease component n=1 Tax=Nostocoides japonicum T1-X7 TaxID=1194083 RepID=A0A077M1M7_9MICO|nr:amino acid ABC transporter permease [Tetrasphaera japonica]CCH79746.1 Putative ABC-type amino acid transport system,permease component [Tetrasphaera japonica T1-X7]